MQNYHKIIYLLKLLIGKFSTFTKNILRFFSLIDKAGSHKTFKRFIVTLSLICVVFITFFARTYDWKNRSGGNHGDKGRDIFVSQLLASGQSLNVGHTASGLNNPSIHYPSTYYYLLSFLWLIVKTPGDFLYLVALWHSLWVIPIIYLSTKIKNREFSVFVGLWYSVSFVWISATYEVVGAWIAQPLMLIWILFWYLYAEKKNLHFLLLSGLTAAVISIFHYSIVPALLAQVITITLFGFNKKTNFLYPGIILVLSFLFLFIILHISQIQFYGIENIIHSWLSSGTKTPLNTLHQQIILITKDQLNLLFETGVSTVISNAVLLIFTLLSIIKGRFSRQMLCFVFLLLLIGSSKQQYVSNFLLPGKVAFSFFILVSFFETLNNLHSKYLKILILCLFCIHSYYTGAFLTITSWKNNEMQEVRQVTSDIVYSLSGYQYRVYAFSEDASAWDTSTVTLWLWFDHKARMFKTTNTEFNFDYTSPNNITILLCLRRNEKPCTELWAQFLRDRHYSSFKYKAAIKLKNHNLLLVCKEECNDIYDSIQSNNTSR